MTIQQIDENTFSTSYRGHLMTLNRKSWGWEMHTRNASTKAWGSLGTRAFGSLEEVEAHYKSWKGIIEFVGESNSDALTSGVRSEAGATYSNQNDGTFDDKDVPELQAANDEENNGADSPFTEEELQVLNEAKGIVERVMSKKTATLKSPAFTKDYLIHTLAHEEREVFGIIILDNRHKIIQTKQMFFGTIDGASVYPREVIKALLKANGAACVCFHNHPSGDPEPSQADITLTRRLNTALSTVDVRLLDHVIVGGTKTVSLAERGQL